MPPTVLRTVHLRLKPPGSLSRWLRHPVAVAFTDAALFFPTHRPVPFDAVARLERVDVPREPSCLLLETARRKRWLLAFESDKELYDWLDDVYPRCPLIAGGTPFGFVHTVHVGFEPGSGKFTGLPSQWTDALSHPDKGSFYNTSPTTPTGPQPPLPPPPPLSPPKLKSKSKSKKLKDHPKPPPTPPSSDTAVLEGTLAHKRDALLVWRWAERRRAVLGPRTLSISRVSSTTSYSHSQPSPSPSPPSRRTRTLTLPLPAISTLARTTHRPYCLLLRLKSGERHLLAFTSDDELYTWYDALHARLDHHHVHKAVGPPTEFRHRVHVGIDPRTGEFTGVPEQWKAVLLGIPQ